MFSLFLEHFRRFRLPLALHLLLPLERPPLHRHRDRDDRLQPRHHRLRVLRVPLGVERVRRRRRRREHARLVAEAEHIVLGRGEPQQRPHQGHVLLPADLFTAALRHNSLNVTKI